MLVSISGHDNDSSRVVPIQYVHLRISRQAAVFYNPDLSSIYLRQASGLNKFIKLTSPLSRFAATIAFLHGICYGLAIDISSAADIRLCSNTPPAQFCVKEVDIGLAADIGTLTRLPKIVGSESWAKEVCLSARVWGADEAARVGFVGRVIEGSKERGVKEVFHCVFLLFLIRPKIHFVYMTRCRTTTSSASSWCLLTLFFIQGARPGNPHRFEVTRSSPRHQAPYELQQRSHNRRRYVTSLTFSICNRPDRASCYDPGCEPGPNARAQPLSCTWLP